MTADERDNFHTILDGVLDVIESKTNVRMSITQSYLSVSGWRTYVEITSSPTAGEVKMILDALDELKADTNPHGDARS